MAAIGRRVRAMSAMTMPKLGDEVIVCIEVPRGSRVKRDATGGIDFVSPVGSPFNYGSIVNGPTAEDGEGVDALVLGPTLPRGTTVNTTIQGIVGFTDRGHADDKCVCKDSRLTWTERLQVRGFFRLYAAVKTLASRHRGGGRSRFHGLSER